MKNGDNMHFYTALQMHFLYANFYFRFKYIHVKLNRPLFYSDYNYLKTCIALHNLLLSLHMHLVFLQSIQGFEKDLKASV